MLDDSNKPRYFSYINSIEIPDQPKGLDDLLISMPGKEAEVVADILTLSRNQKYFITHDVTAGMGKVYKDFRLKDVNEFVEFHSENMQRMARLTGGNENTKVADLKSKEFVYCGTRYKWNDEKSNCEIVRPADANRYFRVGDQYHEKVEVPNKYGDLEKRFDRRMKSTIIDDQTKEIMQHIPKYFAFCNVPNHTNYQPVIHGCYNMYFPFDHEPMEFESEDDFSYTMQFLKHIFGTDDIKVHHKTKGTIVVNELDLGLDFIQLLYQQPQQILPILCLVSKEQGTGKSTFAFWLKELFTQNVAIVGNQDLANDFNAFWAGKLLIICDEAKIDKQVVVEKIKSLSTAKKITVNAKGKDQTEIDFFGKFLMLTNNEDNFIYAGEEDVRYWIRKVPVVKELFV
ncbi:MAG: primase-helicase family protein, partial [Sediminibacterium sp.]